MLLREKDKQTLIHIFKSINLPIEVWAYGSRVNGEAHSGSDLDLVIRTKDLQPINIDDYINIKEKIQMSNIPILVDILDWARIPKSFHENIQKQYEVLFMSIDKSCY